MPPSLRSRLSSVRIRAALGAVVVVGVALLVGSFAFVALVDRSLSDGVVVAVEQDAENVASQLENSTQLRLPDVDDDEQVMQLLDDRGAVVDATEEAEDVNLPSPRDDDALRARIDGEDFLVVVESVEIDGGEYELRVGRSLGEVSDAVGAVSGLLVLAVPLLLTVIGVTTWLIVGRALSPVDRIRQEVDAIGGSDLDRRVVVPSTGDEISRLARTMNGMLERLDRSHRAQRQFVSDASHELRSPIASIRQYAELAQKHPDRIDKAELASTVLAEGIRLQDLVESLLLLTRLDERSGTMQQQQQQRPVDVDDVMLAEVRRLRDTTPLQIDASKVGAGRVMGDERMLSRMLRNVVDNAVRHASQNVAVTLKQTGGNVVISVDDDGPGIAQVDRARVFDRFVRLDDARARDAGGSGLGLAIVADIVRAHGGTVTITASALGGARFTVILPAT